MADTACPTCADPARCLRAGLCQEFAHRALSGTVCPECAGDGFVDVSGFCDLGTCQECGGSGRAKPPEVPHA